MKLSLLTALTLAWFYGTVAGLMLPHGPLAMALYGLLLLAGAGAAHVTRQAVIHHLALAEFRKDMKTACRLAAQAYGGNR